MYYKNIYIRDFGIYNNEKLSNLSKNIVFIGGKNRAGKSTFLDILRYLPFSLPQNNSIPPAANNYYIEAGLEKNKKDYKIVLDGFAAAKAVNAKGDKIAVKQLFNNIDQLSYQQLFTISLQELKQISNLSHNKKEEKKIFSILMGAGLKELNKVPTIAEKYYNKAKAIGGSLGNPDVANFKAYTKQIKKEEKKKEEALKEIDLFLDKKEFLKSQEEKLQDLKTDLKNLERKYFISDFLKNNYQKIKGIIDLELKIENKAGNSNLNFEKDKLKQIREYKNEYEELKADLKLEKEKLSDLTSQTSQEQLTDFTAEILAKEDEILKLYNKIDILKERANNIISLENKISSDFKQLSLDVQELNSDWNKPLQKMNKLKIDLIKEKELYLKLDQFQKSKIAAKNLNREIEDLKFKNTELNNEIKNNNHKNPSDVLKITYISLITGALTGGLTLYYKFYSLFYLSLLIVISGLIYYSSNYNNSQKKVAEISRLKKVKQKNSQQIKNKEKKLKKILDEKKKQKNKLDNYALNLGISEENYINFIKDYFRSISNLKRRNIELNKEKEELEAKKRKINDILIKIYKLLNSFPQIAKDFSINSLNSKRNIFDLRSRIFSALNFLNDNYLKTKTYFQKKKKMDNLKREIKNKLGLFLENRKLGFRISKYIEESKKAEKLESLKSKLTIEKEQLIYSFNSSNKIKKYFLKTYPKKYKKSKTIKSIKNIFYDYSSESDLKKQHLKIEAEIKDKKEETEKVQKNIISLEQEIKKLASSQKIEKAQKNIYQARRDLEKLAEDYALNQTVYFLLNKLRERMIKKAKNNLLKPAADILAKITSNKYNQLQANTDLSENKIIPLAESGEKISDLNSLSRGSLEQLFLAVRLSRIQEIKPPLPLVLDDSLVNFDQQHLDNTAKIINKISKQRQVFLLSCHSRLVRTISELNESVQYWQLKQGKFLKSSAQDLIQYLGFS